MPYSQPSGGFAPDAGDSPGVLTTIERAVLEIDVIGFDVTAPPASPSVGDSYVVGRGATGPWYLWDDDIAIYAGNGQWQRKTTRNGGRAFVSSLGVWRSWNAQSWQISGELGVSRGGLVASSTQAQGQLPLGHALNVIATVATTGDAATLPPAVAGQRCVVANNGASAMQLFPALGDAIDAGAVNASVTIAATKRLRLEAADGTTWISLAGA